MARAVTSLVVQALRFAAVGLLNTVVGLSAIYGLMIFLHLGATLANALGYLLGLAVSFSLNRRWTFASARPVAGDLRKYLLSAGIAYALNLGTVVAAVTSSVNPYLAQLLGVGVHAASFFLACRLFVFGGGKPSDLFAGHLQDHHR